jgi:hypothetical protein
LAKNWTPAFAGMSGAHCADDLSIRYLFVQITPVRIHFLDQFELPGSIPFLDLLFTHEGRLA